MNRRNLALLAVEPLTVLTLLAVPATHDLVRSFPPAVAAAPEPAAVPGPLFWPHLVYTDVLLWTCLFLFVAALIRRGSGAPRASSWSPAWSRRSP